MAATGNRENLTNRLHQRRNRAELPAAAPRFSSTITAQAAPRKRAGAARRRHRSPEGRVNSESGLHAAIGSRARPKSVARNCPEGEALRTASSGRELAERVPIPLAICILFISARAGYTENSRCGQLRADVLPSSSLRCNIEAWPPNHSALSRGTPAGDFPCRMSSPETWFLSLPCLPTERCFSDVHLQQHCPYVAHVRQEILRIALANAQPLRASGS